MLRILLLCLLLISGCSSKPWPPLTEGTVLKVYQKVEEVDGKPLVRNYVDIKGLSEGWDKYETHQVSPETAAALKVDDMFIPTRVAEQPVPQPAHPVVNDNKPQGSQ